MSTQTPHQGRWEWRAFGRDFGPAEALIQEYQEYPARVRTSGEAYIVCDTSSANTKIRDGLLDVKTLQETSADGLEQWRPALKVGFPIPVETLRAIFEIWKLDPVDLRRGAYSRDHFFSEIVEPHRALSIVKVRKEQHGFAIGGCIVEIANLTFDGAPTRTLGIEADDPDYVRSTLHALCLSPHDNVNYVEALKRFRVIASPG